ncbi:maleylpyruvate isomerase N-terminal domain-containing protein [Streptomyces sp. NPDC002990]
MPEQSAEAPDPGDLSLYGTPADPEIRAARPVPGRAPNRGPVSQALIDWCTEGARALEGLLRGLGPDVPVGSWSAERTSGFWLRMQTIELAVHRWDAEAAVATPSALDPRLAADAVTQSFEVRVPRGTIPARGAAGRGRAIPIPEHGRSRILDPRLPGGRESGRSPAPPARRTSRPRAPPRTSPSSSGAAFPPPPGGPRLTPGCSRVTSRWSRRSDRPRRSDGPPGKPYRLSAAPEARPSAPEAVPAGVAGTRLPGPGG